MRDAANGSAEEIGRIVKDFYGFGQTAVDVFSRRMQGEWSELYPCVHDSRMRLPQTDFFPDVLMSAL